MKSVQVNNEEQKVIPNEDPRVTRFQQIFERVMSVGGLEPSKWKTLCLDMPGQIPFVVSLSVLSSIVTNEYLVEQTYPMSSYRR